MPSSDSRPDATRESATSASQRRSPDGRPVDHAGLRRHRPEASKPAARAVVKDPPARRENDLVLTIPASQGARSILCARSDSNLNLQIRSQNDPTHMPGIVGISWQHRRVRGHIRYQCAAARGQDCGQRSSSPTTISALDCSSSPPSSACSARGTRDSAMDAAEVKNSFGDYLADFVGLGRGDVEDVRRILDHYEVPMILSADAGCMVLTNEAGPRRCTAADRRHARGRLRPQRRARGCARAVTEPAPPLTPGLFRTGVVHLRSWPRRAVMVGAVMVAVMVVAVIVAVRAGSGTGRRRAGSRTARWCSCARSG